MTILALTRSRTLKKSLTLAAFLFAALPGRQQDETTAEPFEILFVGDTSFDETYQVHRRLNVLKWKGYDHSLKKLKSILLDSDLVIANLETPITDVRESPFAGKKSFIHKGHVEKTPRTLREHKIKTVSLANNHTMDHGLEGLKQTLEVLRENGMTAMGAALTAAEAAQPYVEEFKIGSRVFKLAVIAAFEYSEVYDRDYRFYAERDRAGVNVLSSDGIKRQIERLKRDDAFVVVFPPLGRKLPMEDGAADKNRA